LPLSIPIHRRRVASGGAHADHVYEERVEEGLEEYRRRIAGEEESRR
jgi:hypothetical protein